MTGPFRPRYFLPGLMSANTADPQIDPQTSPLAQPGNGPIAGFTNTFSLNLVNFDWITWHNYEWENWIVVDALLNAAIGFLNIKGFWKPNTAYLAGQSVFDPDNVSKLYLCLAAHTSSTDFEDDKPLYWNIVDQAQPPVSSVFGRIGDVIALADDYAAFYADKAATQAALSARLPLAGGTMTGALVLAGPPTAALNPATKAYTDAADAAIRTDFASADTALQTAISGKLSLSGGTMTGALLLSAAPTALLEAATKGYVDEKIAALPGAGGALLVTASATPVVLTGTSPNVIVVSGSGTQIITVPSAGSAGIGRVFTIINTGTATINVQASNGSAIGQSIEAGMTATYTCISSSGGGANSWSPSFTGAVARNGSGNALFSVLPTISGALFDAPLTLNANALTPLILRGRDTDQISQIDFRTNDGATPQTWVIRGLPTDVGSIQFRHNETPRMTLFNANSPNFGRLQVFGPISAAASNTDAASLRLPQGVAPTTPANGDIWTQSDGVFARINGSTVNLMTGDAVRGELSVTTAGLTQATFQFPEIANRIAFTFANVTMDTPSTGLRLDFVSATGQVNSVLRQLLGTAYVAPEAIIGAAGAAIDLDGSGVSSGFIGILNFERVPMVGNVQWLFTGALRKGSTMINLNGGRCILNETTVRTFRFRPGAGAFASNPITARWSV